MTGLDDAAKQAADTSAWMRENGYGHHADKLDTDILGFMFQVQSLNARADLARTRRDSSGFFLGLGIAGVTVLTILLGYMVYVWLVMT